jgi:hypothetical protein
MKEVQVSSNKGTGPFQNLQNHCANFNPDLEQIILGRNDSKFQIKGIVPLQGEVIANE